MKFNIIQDKVNYYRRSYQDQSQEEKSTKRSPTVASEIGEKP